MERSMAVATGNVSLQRQNELPRELGLMPRIEGVRTGLEEISARLYGFEAKLLGYPPTTAATSTAAPTPGSINDKVADSEDRIRGILVMIDRLSDSF